MTGHRRGPTRSGVAAVSRGAGGEAVQCLGNGVEAGAGAGAAQGGQGFCFREGGCPFPEGFSL